MAAFKTTYLLLDIVTRLSSVFR